MKRRYKKQKPKITILHGPKVEVSEMTKVLSVWLTAENRPGKKLLALMRAQKEGNKK